LFIRFYIYSFSLRVVAVGGISQEKLFFCFFKAVEIDGFLLVFVKV